VWVAEAYSYPARVPDDQAKDRIVIFEDKDGDGKFDERKVFAEKLNLVSGLELGFGGVWVGAAPHLLFIPDSNGDDVPDGKPQVLLDGWGFQDTHETLNAFTWGPDGWLYGCHGVFTHSRVGKPGTPDAERIPINAGVWRYHPTRHTFEVFAHGTSNPWGVDFNDYGQCFVTACVIPHLYHIVPGGRYERQAGQHFNSYTYDDIKTIADHRHYVGNQWRDADRAKSDDQGGGHAHAGAMVYLGGAWPEEYRGAIFMNNIHGARINMDTLTQSGSGYVASHGPDFVKTNDLWSQIINLQYGPDGNVYMIDWYDKNQCHRLERDVHDRTNGRIFKVSYVGGERAAAEAAGSRRSSGGSPIGDTPAAKRTNRPLPVHEKPLNEWHDADLVAYQLVSAEWYGRHARRVLQERAAAGKLEPTTRKGLGNVAFKSPGETEQLRGLWALHVTGGLDDSMIERGLASAGPFARAWTIQLAAEDGAITEKQHELLQRLAETDPSPVVRLAIAAAAQRLPLEQRWVLVRNLIDHSQDATDPNLSLMIWYAMEPLADVNAANALHLSNHSEIPILLQYMARRVSSSGSPAALAVPVDRMIGMGDDQKRHAFLKGMSEALKGRRQLEMPQGWPELLVELRSSNNHETRQLAESLAVTFGDAKAMGSLRSKLVDSKADPEQRRGAMQSLLAARDPQLAGTLQKLLADPSLRREAIRGLAAYDHAKTPASLLSIYPQLPLAEKRDALATLASRPSYARVLVAAVTEKQIPALDLSADLIRQLRNLNDDELKQRIAEVWGIVRDTPQEKATEIRRYRGMIADKQATPDELPLGRAVFAKTCQQCHTLFGIGAKVGPDLTGSNRADLAYLLSNVVDPSEVVAKEYQPNLIVSRDGRLITGLVLKKENGVLTVATATETVTLPESDIDEMKQADKSMMPDDLLKQLSDDEVRALVAYLASPQQVPVLATADSVKSFFNGVDLAGWDGNPELWSVQKPSGPDSRAEIVGKSASGLKHNDFLSSHLLVGDFTLKLQVKLTPNSANSGIQIRSERLPGGEMRGLQADIGAGWWGKLYEENARGLLWDKSGEAHVRPAEWNDYEVTAVGSRIRTYINGKLCVDLDDPAIARHGVIAFQIHSGGPTEVRFRDLKLELRQAGE
jgi:putative membrane-bound dehydrogenase-like protein